MGRSQGRERNRTDVTGMEERGSPGVNGGRSQKLTLERDTRVCNQRLERGMKNVDRCFEMLNPKAQHGS